MKNTQYKPQETSHKFTYDSKKYSFLSKLRKPLVGLGALLAIATSTGCAGIHYPTQKQMDSALKEMDEGLQLEVNPWGKVINPTWESKLLREHYNSQIFKNKK